MDVPLFSRALAFAAIVGMLLVVLTGQVRTPHAPSLRESGGWSGVYVGIGVVFGLLILWFCGAEHGGEDFAGYVTETRPAIDSFILFVLIMASSGVPRELRQKDLPFGITVALVLRTVLMGFARKVLPASEEYPSDRMTVRLQGKRFITPPAITPPPITPLAIAPASLGRNRRTRREAVEAPEFSGAAV